MKILFDHPDPFLLAHGGFQTQIQQTKKGLEAAGVDVEYLRWWDDGQTGDIIHYFGRPSAAYIKFAHQKNMKVVLAQLLTGLGSRAAWARFIQRNVIRGSETVLPEMISGHFRWTSFRLADACIALTEWEAHLMQTVFRARKSRVHVLPNGVEEAFLANSLSAQRGEWLVCTATIAPRKRVLELGQAAVEAQVPVWIVGKAYSESDPYAREFLELARNNPKFVRYEGAVNDRQSLAQIYRAARGFVLLSTMETRSISAEEAAACGCPLLLSDLPWAKSVFKEKAVYCPNLSAGETATVLKRFYEQAPNLPFPDKPLSWPEVGLHLKKIYETVLKTS